MNQVLSDNKNVANLPLLNNMTTPLCRACFIGKRNMVALLLKHGADIDLKCGGKGYTPVMWAAWRNHLKLVEFLNDSGADFYAETEQGLNVLDI